MFPKSPAWRSPAYLEWIRTLPCCVCNVPSVVAHHLKGVGHFSGAAMKASDILTMPLCTPHHSEFHSDPELLEEQYYYICRTIERAVKEGVLVIYSRGVPGHD